MTDKADAKLLRELLAAVRLPECYIPPDQALKYRATLELYQDPHPDRPRRRRLHRPRPTHRTHHHCPLNHTADTPGQDRQSAVTDEGHQPRPAPLTHCRPHHHPQAMTADGQLRLSGRALATGHPINHHVADTKVRPTAKGKSGCHLATHPHGNASEQHPDRKGITTTGNRHTSIPRPLTTARTAQTTTKILLDNHDPCR
jgi:hypothetical protein